MGLQIVTGNHAAGHALSLAGEANRDAKGVACGIYPITPQTEIVEYVAKFPFSKGSVVPVESEHSAMGVTLGASLAGARAFTASSSNGLAYMFENILVAGWYRLPIVMATVNRTLGPPWNIWADQTDTLCLRDGSWIQFYCESNQEVVDTLLVAFRLAEDHRVLLPMLVSMDAFIVSHTQQETDLPEQDLVDAFLPNLDLPHRMKHEHPVTIGGLAWPRETMSQRLETQEAMERVPAVLEECRAEFQKIFGREAPAAVESFGTEDAETVLVCSGTIATTAREVIKARRAKGEKIGLITQRMMRPYPRAQMIEACQNAKKVGVLDRNYSGGVGGIFWIEFKSALQGVRDDLMVQNYLTGMCGGDVVPSMVEECIDDLVGRSEEVKPIWKGIDA
jgi:pyruvate/2-oxoacid:ferredoxin oxidoreductase alpha subunit